MTLIKKFLLIIVFLIVESVFIFYMDFYVGALSLPFFFVCVGNGLKV